MTSRTKTTQTPADTDERAPWEDDQGVPGVTPPDEQQLEPAGPVAEGVIDDPMQSLMDWCVEYAKQSALDTSEVMAAEVRRILAGEDAEAVLAESKPVNGDDFLDKPFLLHGFTLNETDFKDGWPFYAAMRCTTAQHREEFVITTGGIKIIAALCSLHTIGEYPYPVKLRRADTRAGNKVYSLVAAGA